MAGAQPGQSHLKLVAPSPGRLTPKTTLIYSHCSPKPSPRRGLGAFLNKMRLP